MNYGEVWKTAFEQYRVANAVADQVETSLPEDTHLSAYQMDLVRTAIVNAVVKVLKEEAKVQ